MEINLAVLALSSWLWALLAIALLLIVIGTFLLFYYGSLWIQAYMSDADIRFGSLVAMTFRQVPARMIVTSKIMARQSGLSIESPSGITTSRLEAHFLAGGNVPLVVRAIIAAHRAGIRLDYDEATAMDLAGRDVLDAVRASVSPRVIDCPGNTSDKSMLSGVAKNGVELRVRARVTVRTSMEKLIGGATEKTIIARVGQGIVTTIGSADSHMDVLQKPDSISKDLLKRGLDSNTSFEIVSIDIADIDIGENIDARLQTDQAHADMRVALAAAEARRAGAVATEREHTATIAENRALVLLAESKVQLALASAFRIRKPNQYSTCVDIPLGLVADGRFG